MRKYVDAEKVKLAITEAINAGLATNADDLAEIIDDLPAVHETTTEMVPMPGIEKLAKLKIEYCNRLLVDFAEAIMEATKGSQKAIQRTAGIKETILKFMLEQ